VGFEAVAEEDGRAFHTPRFRIRVTSVDEGGVVEEKVR
jgi:hypothetical protein